LLINNMYNLSIELKDIFLVIDEFGFNTKYA
jgi:hypothetical protein